MGVAIYPVVEDGSGGWTERLDAKCLARAVEALDKIAKKRRVSPLFKFYSWSREDAIIEQLGGDPDDPSSYDESKIIPGKWFTADDGLATVRALLEYVRADGDGLEDRERVQSDLEEFERVLQHAAETNVRWYLGMSA
jgi:hypothetical protein